MSGSFNSFAVIKCFFEIVGKQTVFIRPVFGFLIENICSETKAMTQFRWIIQRKCVCEPELTTFQNAPESYICCVVINVGWHIAFF